MNSESKIIIAAKKEFLFNGYNGTTLTNIAKNAEVNKAIIHYYFRNKVKLYERIIAEIFKSTDWIDETNEDCFSNLWFVLNELRNNRDLFIKAYENHFKYPWGSELENKFTKMLSELSQKEILKNIRL